MPARGGSRSSRGAGPTPGIESSSVSASRVGIFGRRRAVADEVSVEEQVAREDATYASLTPEQREKRYVNPSLWTRMRTFFTN